MENDQLIHSEMLVLRKQISTIDRRLIDSGDESLLSRLKERSILKKFTVIANGIPVKGLGVIVNLIAIIIYKGFKNRYHIIQGKKMLP